MRPILLLRRFSFASAWLVLATSFTGGLTASLGQGFDLGIIWPGTPTGLLAVLSSGSVEPLHRLLTAASGAAVLLTLLASIRTGERRLITIASAAAASLAATAYTGREILLVLGNVIRPPLAYAIYPLNTALATLTAAFLFLLRSGSARPSAGRWLYGAAACAFAAVVTGSYILGYEKVEKAYVNYFGFSVASIPFYLHLAFAGLAFAFAGYSTAAYKTRGNWTALAHASMGILAITGIANLLAPMLGANPLSPGPQLAFHLLFAQLFFISILMSGRSESHDRP